MSDYSSCKSINKLKSWVSRAKCPVHPVECTNSREMVESSKLVSALRI